MDSTSHSRQNHFALLPSSLTAYTSRILHNPKLYELTTNIKSYQRQINGINFTNGSKKLL